MKKDKEKKKVYNLDQADRIDISFFYKMNIVKIAVFIQDIIFEYCLPFKSIKDVLSVLSTVLKSKEMFVIRPEMEPEIIPPRNKVEKQPKEVS